ncbi:MAG: hypothetical protein JSW07_12825 [bacterium]|nr:MAG: hypothetical protein JSW07_12825 [bacterium]
MKKISLVLIVLSFCIYSHVMADSPSFENPNKFSTEFLFGLRVPVGKTSNDILSGFALKFGVGYQITKNLEIFHLAFDFGSSSPHDPAWVEVYDPYSYYPRLEQETVSVYGFPLTMRYRSQIKEQLELYLGAGVAYYWFRTRLADPYWGELKQPRKRHGPGGIFEAGLFTDAFSEKLLVGLTTNFMYLHTKGKTLTTPKQDESDEKTTRYDTYLAFAITLRYYMGK